MSTWTNVTDTVLEPGQPIRSVDIIAIKNNILAVPAGAANAPRIKTAAIDNAQVTAAKLATGNNERDWVLARYAGAAYGAVGTYTTAFSQNLTQNVEFAGGGTVAGSALRRNQTNNDNGIALPQLQSAAELTGLGLGGTWRLMMPLKNVFSDSTSAVYGLYLRIS
jgi:hypothetical protein